MQPTLRLPVTMLACIGVSLAFVTCGKDEEKVVPATCSTDLRITAVYPDNNPVGAPILIKGRKFTPKTEVFFDTVRAEVSYVADTVLTTRVPAKLKATHPLSELRVKDGACGFTTGFRVTKGFVDFQRASPPVIFFPKESEKLFVSVHDSVTKYRDSFDDFGSGYSMGNVWGDDQILWFDATNTSTTFEGERIVNITGVEEIRSIPLQTNTLTGEYYPVRNKVKIIIFHNGQLGFDDSEVLPGDNLEGGFYRTTLVTREGRRTMNILFLQSLVTGRQYLFDLR